MRKPSALSSLHELGLSDKQIDALAKEIECELCHDRDLDDILGKLDVAAYCGKIDISSVADRTGIEPRVVRAAMNVIAPLIAR